MPALPAQVSDNVRTLLRELLQGVKRVAIVAEKECRSEDAGDTKVLATPSDDKPMPAAQQSDARRQEGEVGESYAQDQAAPARRCQSSRFRTQPRGQGAAYGHSRFRWH